MKHELVPIVVSHISEEHGHVAQQRCHCGGCFEVEMWEMIQAENGFHELAHARCVTCDQTRDFLFDITPIFEEYVSTSRDPFNAAWPMAFEGPYGVRRTDFHKDGRQILMALERGEISAAESEEQQQQLINSTFPRIQGRYQVFGCRKGTMGFTYLCADTEYTPDSPRPYAVVCKCLGFSQDHEVRIDDVTSEAIRHEARIWLELGEHPNIVRLLDVLHVTPESTILVLEAVLPGPKGYLTLQDWIEGGELVWPMQRRYAADLVRALLHASHLVPGFVHGDLKPSNLLIDVAAGYRLKVTDFGLSRAANLELPKGLSSLGSGWYMAPECWNEKKFTPKSDIYALGLLVHEIIFGHHALHDVRDQMTVCRRHQAGIKLPDFNLPESQVLLQLLQRCVSVDPDMRPSLEEIAEELGVSLDRIENDEESSRAADLNNKATGLMALGHHREALPLLLEAVQLEPTIAAGWANLAVAYSNCGLLNYAQAAFERCFSNHDASAQIYAAYAAHLMRFREKRAYVEAIAACEKAIEIEPESFHAWSNKAAALNSLARYKEASDAAKTARKLDPAQPYALVELAFASWKLGRYAKARNCTDKALKISPGYAPAHNLKREMQKHHEI